MAFARIIKIDNIKSRLYFVSIRMIHQMIICYLRKIGKLIVVDIHGKTLLNLLFDIVVNNSVRFSTAGSTQYNSSSKRIHNINPSIVLLFSIPEAGRKINRIFIIHKLHLLHKGFILYIKNIIHQINFNQP